MPQLVDLIKNKIKNSDEKAISFAEYMQMALYEPNYGYYVNDLPKFGPAGDFITAPMISPVFANCLSMQIAQVLQNLPQNKPKVILELGAGLGDLAYDLILSLAKTNNLPDQYCILEVSGFLQKKQQVKLAELSQYTKITWLTKLPDEPINGVIIGNEVIDALPVNLFKINNNNIFEGLVKVNQSDNLYLDYSLPITQNLTQELNKLLSNQTNNNFSDSKLDLDLDLDCLKNYTSEINLFLKPWLESIAQTLDNGIILFLDYGFTNHEFYHPDRIYGTLVCHKNHHTDYEPLSAPGQKDITSHVNFSHLNTLAAQFGLSNLGFTSQANFLINCSLDEICSELFAQCQASNPDNWYKISQSVAKLTLPHEMGELFKAIALGKNIQYPLLGFATNDYSKSL